MLPTPGTYINKVIVTYTEIIMLRLPSKKHPPAQNPNFRPPPSAPMPSYNLMQERPVARDPVVRPRVSTNLQFESLQRTNLELRRGLQKYSNQCHGQLRLLAEREQTIMELVRKNLTLELKKRELEQQNDDLRKNNDELQYERDSFKALVNYLRRPNSEENDQALSYDEEAIGTDDDDSEDSYSDVLGPVL